jgi:hypothetical protein
VAAQSRIPAEGRTLLNDLGWSGHWTATTQVCARPWSEPVRPNQGPLAHPQAITASPGKIGDIARDALVLSHFEYGYLEWNTAYIISM